MKTNLFADCCNCELYTRCGYADAMGIRPINCDNFLPSYSEDQEYADDFTEWDIDNPESFI